MKEQKPRVMTLKEVEAHYTVPDNLTMHEEADYENDIRPLYFDFPTHDEFEVHWHGYDKTANVYLKSYKHLYGRFWRCWTDVPTKEQQRAVKWDG